MYYTVIQLRTIAKERGVKLKHGSNKTEICAELGIKLTANLVYQQIETSKAIRIINQDTHDTTEFRSIYNLAKTLGLNDRDLVVKDPAIMWKSDTVIEAGKYRLELV